MAQASAALERGKPMSDRAARSEPPRAWRADLDGIRALAILSVVLSHAGVPLLTGGFTGVDIFFVLSGYLIGGHIWTELRNGEFSYLGFYRRRAKRIFPAFYLVLACTVGAGLILLAPLELARLGRGAFAATLSGSNILFWHGANYFDTRSELNPLLMTWSLGVEEQFYAVIPLLMVLVARVRRGWMLPAILTASALSFFFAWAALASYPTLVFYMLPARAWELGVGVALAVFQVNQPHFFLTARVEQAAGLAGLALMIAPLFLLRATTAFPGPAALPSVAGAALAIAAPASWMNRKVLSLPPIVFIGKISYSWYLWHWPLLAFLHIAYGGDLPRTAAFGAIVLSFAAAVASFYLVEQPLRGSRRAARPLLIRYALASAAILAMCAAIWLSRGVPERFPGLARMEKSSATLYSDACLADEGSDAPNMSADCINAADARPVVVLWGDSHAAAISPGLRSLAEAQRYAFAELAKASCPPVIGAAHFIPRHPRLAAECMRFDQRTLNVIRNNARIKIVILNASWAGYLHRSRQDGWLVTEIARQGEVPSEEAARATLAQSLMGSIGALQAAGKQAIVLDDIPTFDFEPLWKIATAQIPARRALASWLGVSGADDTGFAAPGDGYDVRAASSLLQQAVDAEPGAKLVDLKTSLCDEAQRCEYREGDRLLYIDNNHLSQDGAHAALKNFHLPPADAMNGERNAAVRP